MSDATLLSIGAAIFFIAVGGAYVYIRETYGYRTTRSVERPVSKLAELKEPPPQPGAAVDPSRP